MKRKVLSIVICLAMLMSTFALMPMTAGAEEVVDGTDPVNNEQQIDETIETEPAEEPEEVTEPTEAVEEPEATEPEEETEIIEETVTSEDEIAETEETVGSAVNFTDAAPLVSRVDSDEPEMPMLFAAAFSSVNTAMMLAEGEEPTTPDGLELDKTATDKGNGEYEINLEAYTTGTVRTEVISNPADIVLVVMLRPKFLGENFADGTTKMEASIKALNNFLDSIEEQNKDLEDGQKHRVAIYFEAKEEGALNSVDSSKVCDVNLTTDISLLRGQLSVDKFTTSMHADNSCALANTLAGENGSGGVLRDLQTENSGRDKTIILFTDTCDKASSVNAAYTAADNLKTVEPSTTIYSVGIFDGADPTSADLDSTSKFPSSFDKELPTNAQRNYYMHRVSSNYPNNYPTQEGTDGYYLSANDSDALNDVFQNIYEQIGSPSIELDEETVIKDIVAPQFDVPANASDITVKAVPCTGFDANGEPTWATNGTILDSSSVVKIDGDTVNVTGFNFNENFVAEEGRGENKDFYGQKLVITFTVKADKDFLGGNDVYTNGPNSGLVAKDEEGEDIIYNFERPTVDVPANAITPAVQDQNIYLTDAADLTKLINGFDSRINGTNNEYVDITYKVKDGDTLIGSYTIPKGKTAGTWTWDPSDAGTPALEDDKTYTISCETNGGTDNTAVTKDPQPTATVNVFKPELTFKDSEVYYGETINGYDSNLVNTAWKHNGTEADQATMGNAPSLDLGYLAAGIENNVVKTKDDIPVNVTVKVGTKDITSKTAFVHQPCDSACGFDSAKCEFLLHVKTCSLTINKDVDGTVDSNQSFIFTVESANGNNTLEVVVQGEGSATITGLPLGNYTVTEKDDWSWRYDPADIDKEVTLSRDNANGSVEFVNKRNINKWLNGNAYCENAFN